MHQSINQSIDKNKNKELNLHKTMYNLNLFKF